MHFKELHQTDTPLLIANVWDAPSTIAAQKAGYSTLGTSSGAMATLLGYEDGENMSFDELLFLVRRILQSTNLPLTVDLEAGYSRDPEQIVQHILQLIELGIVGINLEDSLVIDGKRQLLPGDEFQKTLRTVCKILSTKQASIFINVRTDTFLLQHSEPVKETIQRAELYQSAGANGLFVPCIEKASQIAQVIEAIDLPLNVMCMPGLPNFSTLQQLGVKRISMGNFIHNKILRQYQQAFSLVLQDQSFKTVFE